MAYNDRLALYRQIEELRRKPLIVFVTSLRPNGGGQIATDVIPEFARQIMAIPKEGRDIDLLIVSNGGDPTVAWRMVSILRERFDSYSTLLPYASYSAATLLAMGANDIIMHPFANLGPVDPQITISQPNEGSTPQHKLFGSEDLTHYLSFVREDVGITDQAQLEKSFELLCKDVGALPVGAAKRSAQLMLSLGEKLLNMHMEDRNEAKTIAVSLNKSFYNHGYPVGRTEAKKIGLPISDPPEDLEILIWNVWQDIENEMKCNVVFSPLEVVLNDPKYSQILTGPIPHFQIPNGNFPPEFLQKIYSQVLQQVSIINLDPVDYEVFHATVESTRCRSEYKTHGKINATRLPDMNISISVVPISQKWSYTTN